MSKTQEAPFLVHLVELRQCLARACLSVLVGFAASVYFSKEIYAFLAAPLLKVLPDNSYFIATHPFEAWVTYLKTALFAGLFLSLPVVLTYLWRFIAPGLKAKEKRFSLLFVLFSTLLFVGGSLFGYFYVFPYAFAFFTEVTQGTDIVFLPQMKDYLSFSFRLLIAFGLIFELPIILIILSITGLVPFSALVSFQKYMIVVAFLISAFLTPPDVITQILMGLPIILLYEIGLLIGWVVRKRS